MSARSWAGWRSRVARHGQPFKAPCVLLSGGETTVTVRGHGRGGRNVEYLLSLALTLRGEPGVHAIAGDTDGVDGQEEIAGALAGPDTPRARLAAWHPSAGRAGSQRWPVSSRRSAMPWSPGRP